MTLHRDRFYRDGDVTWWHFSGRPLGVGDWHDHGTRSLGLLVGEWLILLHAGDAAPCTLPPGGPFTTMVDSTRDDGTPASTRPLPGGTHDHDPHRGSCCSCAATSRRPRRAPHTRDGPRHGLPSVRDVRRSASARPGSQRERRARGRAAVSSDRAALRLPLPPVLHHLRGRPPHGRRRRSGALPARARGHRQAAEHRRPRRPGRRAAARRCPPRPPEVAAAAGAAAAADRGPAQLAAPRDRGPAHRSPIDRRAPAIAAADARSTIAAYTRGHRPAAAGAVDQLTARPLPSAARSDRARTTGPRGLRPNGGTCNERAVERVDPEAGRRSHLAERPLPAGAAVRRQPGAHRPAAGSRGTPTPAARASRPPRCRPTATSCSTPPTAAWCGPRTPPARARTWCCRTTATS